MSRLGVAATLGMVLCATSAHAAEPFFGGSDPFRPSYDLEWAEEDTLSFELGLRYWYSQGEVDIGIASANDTTQSVEAHFRIDDWSTATYARGHAGVSAIVDGTHGDPSVSYSDGRLAYARADLGYNLYQTDNVQLSLFAGYGYNNQEIEESGIDIHQLRLGVSAHAGVNDLFDIYAEAAAIPYAFTTTYGEIGLSDGQLYGYSAEMMAGFEPGPNVLIRAGVRAEYLTGPLVFETGEVDTETFRWGPLVELTYAF